MLKLSGTVHYYLWGSITAIPDFRGDPPDGRPHAEVWFGAHPSAPSLASPAMTAGSAAEENRSVLPQPLNEIIATSPELLLGDEVAARFDGQLPYLVKLLAATQPLSLQVHPTITQARDAYDREQNSGIPADDRNYRDRNHKPEALIALSPTLAYAGFRQPGEIAADLLVLAEHLDARDADGDSRSGETAQALRGVVGLLTKTGESSAQRIESGFVATLDLPPDLLTAALAVLFQYDAADPNLEDATFSSLEVARYVLDFFPQDSGVLGALFLNHVALAPGEALSVGAGVIHCYIHGFGVEVMANSDNVLRAGLTAKRVNVPELVRVVDFDPGVVPVVHGVPRGAGAGAGGAVDYVFPVDEFEVTVIEGSGERTAFEVGSTGPRLVLGINGTVTIESDQARCEITAGESFFAGDPEIIAISGTGTAMVISVPLGA